MTGTPTTTTVPARERPQPPTGGALLAGLGACLLYAAGLFRVVLSPLAGFAPLPLLVARLRYGPGAAAAGFVLAASTLAMMARGAALAFVLLALPLMMIAESTARGRGLRRGCIWAFLLLSGEIAVALVFANASVETVTFGALDYYRSDGFLSDMRAAGVPPEQIEGWTEQMRVTDRVLRIVYPSVYIVLGGLLVLLNGAAVRLYLAWRDPGWLEGNEFEGLRWPFPLAIGFVLAGLGVLSPLARPASYNALVLLGFLFALQGLAVVTFYALRLAAPPFLRWAALVLVIMNPWSPHILALIGLFDLWFDFRKWAEAPAPPRG